MSGLLTKPLGQVLAALLLATVGAGLGAWLAAGHYRPQLDQAQQQIAAGAAAVASCITTSKSLQASVTEQNQALVDLQRQAAQVAERAQAAQAAAEQKAVSAERRAQQILAERPAPGADVCTAARDAFDIELKGERGK